MKQLISHLILSGGGFKGFVYLGFLRYLYIENMIDNIKYIAGTSIGAYFAAIIALKIPIEYYEKEIYEAVKNIKIKNNYNINNNTIPKLFTQNGMLSLDFLLNIITKFLKSKYDVYDLTFIEFIKKTGVNVYFSCSNLNKCNQYIFSAEHTPNISIIEAMRASMSIPFLFEPVIIEEEYYIDGCITTSFTFDNIFQEVDDKYKLFLSLHTNNDNIVISKETAQEILDINSLTYFLKVFNTIYKSKFEKKIKDVKENILIFHDIENNSINMKIDNNKIVFDVSEESLNNLILNGYIHTTNYFAKNK